MKSKYLFVGIWPTPEMNLILPIIEDKVPMPAADNYFEWEFQRLTDGTVRVRRPTWPASRLFKSATAVKTFLNKYYS